MPEKGGKLDPITVAMFNMYVLQSNRLTIYTTEAGSNLGIIFLDGLKLLFFF